MLIFRSAVSIDIKGILRLNESNNFKNISNNSGFVRIAINEKILKKIVNNGLAQVCLSNNEIVGYYIIAGEGGDNQIQYLMDVLLKIKKSKLHETLVGTQACVQDGFRNRGVGKKLFTNLVHSIPSKYNYLFGSITKINKVGYIYSVEKLKGDVIFEDIDRYYILFDVNKLKSL